MDLIYRFIKYSKKNEFERLSFLDFGENNCKIIKKIRKKKIICTYDLVYKEQPKYIYSYNNYTLFNNYTFNNKKYDFIIIDNFQKIIKYLNINIFDILTNLKKILKNNGYIFIVISNTDYKIYEHSIKKKFKIILDLEKENNNILVAY